MEVKLFEKIISIKDKGCKYGSLSTSHIPPAVNLFVKVTNGCNAHCAFCSNSGYFGEVVKFDHNKLWQIVDELVLKGIFVNRINITGGEPATVPLIVNCILERASAKIYKRIHLHLNTNGILPSSQVLMQNPRWDSISVSLHHYDPVVL
ncbi:MAG: radical SAM protein, partial [Muribaculaceae bacterium]|nr:radical SAM protein [Muribaculaceae bacterium]